MVLIPHYENSFDVVEQTIKAPRKLRKFGHSIGLTLPLEFIKKLGLEPDEDVKIELDLENSMIRIILDSEGQVAPDVFVRYENGKYHLWNHLIMQANDLNELLIYQNKFKLKSVIREIGEKQYFVVEL